MPTRDDCERLDLADPLRDLRGSFDPGQSGTIYLDANSIGAMPKNAGERILHAMKSQWSDQRALSIINHSDLSIDERG